MEATVSNLYCSITTKTKQTKSETKQINKKDYSWRINKTLEKLTPLRKPRFQACRKHLFLHIRSMVHGGKQHKSRAPSGTDFERPIESSGNYHTADFGNEPFTHFLLLHSWLPATLTYAGHAEGMTVAAIGSDHFDAATGHSIKKANDFTADINSASVSYVPSGKTHILHL